MTLRILLALALCAGAIPASAQSVDSLLATGDLHFEAGDNNRALADYQYAAERAPEAYETVLRLAQAWNYRAIDLIADGRDDAAEQALDKARGHAEQLREAYPDRAPTWFQLCLAYGNTALYRGGRDKVRIGRDVESFAEKAIELDPGYALPHVTLGIFYREVAELNWVQRTLANALFGGVPDGSYERAVRHLKDALELAPDNVSAHYELAITLDRMDRTDEAIPHARAAANGTPENSDEQRKKQLANELVAEWDA